MTKKIIPAILPADYFDLEKHLERVKGVTDFVQIDVCNGTYTPSKTWPFTHTPDIYFDKMVSQEEGMPFWESIDFEIDLMVMNPEEVYEQFMQIGPSRIIFHFETMKNPLEFISRLKEEQSIIEIGIAFSNDTRAIDHKGVIELADVVQCMGISKIGFQGQKFDERVLEQVREIREAFPDKIIAVDGSVNDDTLSDLSDAGVNHFVTGSAFFRNDSLIETLEDFENLVN
jgi:ribulose-phosphate 3-epimerase